MKKNWNQVQNHENNIFTKKQKQKTIKQGLKEIKTEL